jgi:hypothetical protein
MQAVQHLSELLVAEVLRPFGTNPVLSALMPVNDWRAFNNCLRAYKLLEQAVLRKAFPV